MQQSSNVDTCQSFNSLWIQFYDFVVIFGIYLVSFLTMILTTINCCLATPFEGTTSLTQSLHCTIRPGSHPESLSPSEYPVGFGLTTVCSNLRFQPTLTAELLFLFWTPGLGRKDPSVRPSVRLSVRRFSQNQLISFFLAWCQGPMYSYV